MTSSYCAPCIADLALVREAVTSVAGTASCMAHAVLLTHGTDDPARRRQRLEVLGDLARGKAETAEPAEQVKLELLVQEYGLAGAMDMGTPSRRSGGQQRGGGQGQHGGQHQGQHGFGQHGGQAAGAPGEERRPKSRRGRGRGEGQAQAGQSGQGQSGQGQSGQGQSGQGQSGQGQSGQGQSGGESRRDRRGGPVGGTGAETAPVTPAPGPAGEGVPADIIPVSASLADVTTLDNAAPAAPPTDSAPADTALSASPGAPEGASATAAPAEVSSSAPGGETSGPADGAPTGGGAGAGSSAGGDGSAAGAQTGGAPSGGDGGPQTTGGGSPEGGELSVPITSAPDA